MDEALRNTVGKVLFEELADYRRNWEDQSEDVKEHYRHTADKAIEAYQGHVNASQ